MGVTISHTFIHINNNHQLSRDSLLWLFMLLALTGLLEWEYLRVAHQLLLRRLVPVASSVRCSIKPGEVEQLEHSAHHGRVLMILGSAASPSNDVEC
jgi:hypothetical protein